MPVITMVRGDEVATVDTDYTATFENFLAHGWKHEGLTEDNPAPVEPEVDAPVAPPAQETVTHRAKRPKAR